LNRPVRTAPNFVRRRLIVASGAAAFARAALGAASEERTIKMIALEAGAQSDSVARVFAPAMARVLKQRQDWLPRPPRTG
jgi:tripartite-type tricarboxylate transporter receptor subunit TctC